MRTVQLEDYDAEWPLLFDKEVAVLGSILSSNLAGAYHIGSTAITGIKAKPIIDILLEVRSHRELDKRNEELGGVGYEPLGEFGIEGRRFFQKGGDERTHHLHAFESGHPEIERHRLFVAFMNSHPREAREYEALKCELAKAHRHDPEQYTNGKSDFIAAIDAKLRVLDYKGV